MFRAGSTGAPCCKPSEEDVGDVGDDEDDEVVDLREDRLLLEDERRIELLEGINSDLDLRRMRCVVSARPGLRLALLVAATTSAISTSSSNSSYRDDGQSTAW